MELKEARDYADRIRTYRLTHSIATDAPWSNINNAIVTLDDRITELDKALYDLLKTADYGYTYHSYYEARKRAKALLKEQK